MVSRVLETEIHFYGYETRSKTFKSWVEPFQVKISLKLVFITQTTPLLLPAVPQRCSVKKVFLEISQNSQENAYARVCF